MPGSIRVLIADDHPVICEGLKTLITLQPDMNVVGESLNRCEADVAVVGDITASGTDAPTLIAELRRKHPQLRILALTSREDGSYLKRLLATDTAGYIHKRTNADELVRALRVVAAGGIYLDPAVETIVASDSAHSPTETPVKQLSERETQVVRLIALGYSNKEIAAQLNLSIKTIETYKTRSQERLGARNRVDIVRYAAGRGWLSDHLRE